MTKQEKFQKATVDHKYALARIEELERELSDMRFRLRDRNLQIAKLNGTHVPRRPHSNYEASRWEQG